MEGLYILKSKDIHDTLYECRASDKDLKVEGGGGQIYKRNKYHN